MTSNARTLILAITSLVFLSACGGSGGGTPDPVVVPPPADTTLDWDEDNWDEKDWV